MQSKTAQNKATAANLPVHLSVREAAAYLEISTSSLYGLFRSRALPYVTVGKHRRVLGADLARYLGVPGVGPRLVDGRAGQDVGVGEGYPRTRSEGEAQSEAPGPAGARDPNPLEANPARAPEGDFMEPSS